MLQTATRAGFSSSKEGPPHPRYLEAFRWMLLTRVFEEKLASLRFTMPEQSAPVLAQFLHLPGVKEPEMESEEWKRSMYFVVYDTLAALARERPLLIVLEDLHYADSASLNSHA